MAKKAPAKPYTAPRVTTLGTLAELTLGSSGSCADGGSGNFKPSGISGCKKP